MSVPPSSAPPNPAPPNSAAPELPTGWRIWWEGARPKTLPAAVVPVAVGAAVAELERGGATIEWWRAVVALVVSLALQVGVNYANDYSDGVRGTDNTGVRVGPPRLVGWSLASPAAVRAAALIACGVACVAGLALAVVTSWWLLLVGASAVLAAWGYTGGPRPYGYAGLGELFVFVYFGLVAVSGTTYVLIERVPVRAVVAAVPVGLLVVGLLVVNNLRDIPGDTVVGKNTLAVRLGDGRTRTLYLGLVVVAFALVPAVALVGRAAWGALAAFGAVAVVGPPVRSVRGGALGRDLIAVLVATARLHLVFGALLAGGLFVSALA